MDTHPTPPKPGLRPATRDELVAAIRHGMLFRGRKREHHWDHFNAQVAAERLADALLSSNLVVMHGPPAPDHSGDTAFRPAPGDRNSRQ